MFHLLLAVIYLAFISLGLPDALLGLRMALHVSGLSCTRFLRRNHFHDHSRRYRYI